MSAGYRLLGILAHPDDESRIVGGTLAKYAGEGVRVCLWVGTRGEATTLLGNPPVCTPEELPGVRLKELEEACRVLGIQDVLLRDYPDGGLEGVDRNQVVGDMV